MLPSPRRASDKRIGGRNRARSPGGNLRKNISEETGGDDTFDLFSGALNNNSLDARKARSASVGCNSDSIRKRPLSPKRGSPDYLTPVANPHKVTAIGPEVKQSSSDDETIDEKKEDVRIKPQGQITDILVLMHEGMKMYKFGKKNSKPKLKTIYLSKDNRYLKWSSQLKKADKKQVEVTTIKRVEGGIKSDVFEQVMNLPRDGNFSLNPNLAISIYYEPTPQKPKTLNLIATVSMHHQIWIEGLRRLSKICKSGGDPGNIIEIFHSIVKTVDYHHSSPVKTESKSFRWEKINPDVNEARSVSPSREVLEVEITTGSGVQKRAYSKLMPAKPSFAAKSWV